MDEEYTKKAKEKDAERKREARRKLKIEESRSARYKRSHEREMQAERQKRYRARKKAAKMAETEPTEGRCEKKKKDRTEYYRKYREKKRQEMSRQKKQAIKAKDRVRKSCSKKTTAATTTPDSPEAYSSFIEGLIENCSPKKRQNLAKKGIRSRKDRETVDTCIKRVRKLIGSLKQRRCKRLKQVNCMWNHLFTDSPKNKVRELASLSLNLVTSSKAPI